MVHLIRIFKFQVTKNKISKWDVFSDLCDEHVDTCDCDHQVAGHFSQLLSLVEEVEDQATADIGWKPK